MKGKEKDVTKKLFFFGVAVTTGGSQPAQAYQ